jgi:thiol-disulfide isomerase/thioredoxin
MKRTVVSLLFVMAAVLAAAEPAASDIALMEKYRDKAIAPNEKYYNQANGQWKGYRFPDGMYLWVHAGGGDMQANLPDGTVIRITLSEGKEISRTLQLPSGRVCTIDADGNVEWGLVMEPAPDFTLGVLGGSGAKVSLSGCKGKLVLLDFWASWCQPCMHALPETEALYMKYKGRGLLVYGVNIEGDTAKASAAVQSLGLTFPVLMGDPDANGEYHWNCRQITDYRIHGIPALFLIDGNGVVLSMDADDEEIEKHLKR